MTDEPACIQIGSDTRLARANASVAAAATKSGRLHSLLCFALVAIMAGFVSPLAVAHEFWLEPIDYRPDVGASVPVVHRSGQEMVGLSYPYLSEDTVRFSVVDGKGERPISAIEGDDPAAEVTLPNAGLAAIVFEGAINEVVFPTFAKFEESLRFERLDHIIAKHKILGLPMAGITERYFRCAKSLVAVGGTDGEDRSVGLPLELVAEQNPYRLDVGDALSVRLLYGGKPLSGAVIKVFTHETATTPHEAVTDLSGRATVILATSGEHMLHSVYMRPPENCEGGHWFSIWASLTFSVKR